MLDAIRLSYKSKGLQTLFGLCLHVEEISKGASWASLHTFAKFYILNVTAPSLVRGANLGVVYVFYAGG